MKNLKKTVNKNFLKKFFIKICRILGFEIIEQNNLFIPTSNKFVNEELSVGGKKSINLPLGEVKITRSVISLDVIFKTCTSVNLVSQSKKRVFEEKKSEYSFRSLNSIIKNIIVAKNNFPNVSFKIILLDNNSSSNDLNIMEKNLILSKISHKIVNVDINEFKDKIHTIGNRNEKVENNMKATMASIYKSFLLAKEKCDDLIYFVEDDYIHQNEAIAEMLFSYERIASQIKKDLIICPSDYPFLYNKLDDTQIYLGNKRHWRTTKETLLTFMLSKKIIEKHWDEFEKMCKIENSPFEKPLHEIYENELCLSPIPSLAMHCTNVNSVFGLPPNFDWKEVWIESKKS